MKIAKPYQSYEAHLPIKINKKKYLEVMSLPEVQSFMKTNKVLHKRTLYKNYDKPDHQIVFKEDVKLFKRGPERINNKINICGWVSVADGVVGNPGLPIINNLLRSTFPTPCKYETNGPTTRGMIYKKKNKFF